MRVFSGIKPSGEMHIGNYIGAVRRWVAEQEAYASAGLFDYPVLMAADILLYDTNRVPVGDDQRQHVDLARDIAIRFNSRFGNTFVVPEAILPPVGARIRDLQNPEAKMSKSDVSPMGTIIMLDTPERILKKIKAAVTDSESTVCYDTTAKPGIANLLELFSAVVGKPVSVLESEYATSGHGRFKQDLAEAIIEMLRPVQQAYYRLESAPDELKHLLARGAERAREIATPKLQAVRKAVGLTTP